MAKKPASNFGFRAFGFRLGDQPAFLIRLDFAQLVTVDGKAGFRLDFLRIRLLAPSQQRPQHGRQQSRRHERKDEPQHH